MESQIKQIANPLLKKELEIEINDDTVEINILNIGKFFREVYVLCPLKNEPVDLDICKSYIPTREWDNVKHKLVLKECSIKLIKNKYHYENISLVSSESVNLFNHFGYELGDEILVVPIFDISYLNLIEYLKLYNGVSDFKTLWNLVYIKDYFCKCNDISYSSKIQLTEMIKLLDESNYWTLRYNCLCNISKSFNERKFQLSYTKSSLDKSIKVILDDLDKDNIENNYLTMIFNNKNFVDASSTITKYGYKLYRIRNNSDISTSDVNQIFDKLNTCQQFYFFTNLLVSKYYSHNVINNIYILDKMKYHISYFIELFRYLISYSWIRFYFEECIKKTWTKKTDDFIFDINTANKLPTFPVVPNDIKSNPYLPIMVDNSSLQSENNIGGVEFSFPVDENNKSQPGVITTLDGFRNRFNVFMTGNTSFNIFDDLNFEELGIGISGSVMTACLQENPPLLELFVGKNIFNSESSFDLDWSRYFSEYYSDADLDVMIKGINPIDFIKKSKIIHNQLVVNVCNKGADDLDIVKYTVYRTIFIFVDEDFIRNSICTDILNYEYIVSNLKEEKIVNLIKPYFNNKIDEFYKKLLSDFDEDEIATLKSVHPELFELNKTIYEVHFKKGKQCTRNVKSFVDIDEDQVEKMLDDIIDSSVNIDESDVNKYITYECGVNITFKAKIEAKPYILRVLELFPILGDDFFGIVSKFHLPCVRSYYDGNNVYLTPSCISAHKTYWNIDYKYFAGSKDPIEIINKYRMRGFGTFLNKKEIDKLIKYSSCVPYWNNLYDIKLNNKSSISGCLGQLKKDHKLFHTRFYNAEFYKYNDIDLTDPYNNIIHDKSITTNGYNNVKAYYTKYYPNYYSFGFLDTMRGINNLGYIEPLQKWVIESAFNIFKINNVDSKVFKSNDDNVETKPHIFEEENDVVEYFSNQDNIQISLNDSVGNPVEPVTHVDSLTQVELVDSESV